MPGSLARDARPTLARPTCSGLGVSPDAPSGLDVTSDAGRRPAPPCPGQDTAIVPSRETPTDRRARGTIRVSLSPSLPGRMPGSLARDARPTYARPTVVGWASRPMLGGVPRRPVPGKLRRWSRVERHQLIAAREERSAPRCRHRSPAGCRGASRGTRDPLWRDPHARDPLRRDPHTRDPLWVTHSRTLRLRRGSRCRWAPSRRSSHARAPSPTPRRWCRSPGRGRGSRRWRR